MVILASTRIVTQRLITPRVLQGSRVEPKRMPGKLHFFMVLQVAKYSMDSHA